MVVCLEVVAGSLLGQRYKIWEGIRIGRSQGDVLINDAKISAIHAQVEKDGRGNLVLVDQDSANGLKINGQRVKRIAMLLGVTFQLGRTSFRVIEVSKEAPPEIATGPSAKKKNWKETLLTTLPSLVIPSLPITTPVQAFRPALQLDFLEGAQMDQHLVLGYGPRRFGADVLDIELNEPMCPPLAFEILCENGVPFFRTHYPSLVLVNNKPNREALLREGDLIRLGQTLIRVGFAS